jgi:hypothetical protein
VPSGRLEWAIFTVGVLAAVGVIVASFFIV